MESNLNLIIRGDDVYIRLSWVEGKVNSIVCLNTDFYFYDFYIINHNEWLNNIG